MPSMTDNIQLTQVHLPSKGKAYPPGTQVFTRPYTLGEIRQLSGDLSRKQVLSLLVKGVAISGSSMKVPELTMGDVDYIATLRKVLTLGDGESISIKLTRNDVVYERTIKLTDIPFKEMGAEACPITVDRLGSRDNVTIYPLTLEKYTFVTERYTGKMDREMVLMGAMLIKGSDFSKIDEEANFVASLTGDGAAIFNLVVGEEYNHGIEDIVLESGDKKMTYKARWEDGNLSFFRSKGGSKDDLRKHLRFGKVGDLPA